MLIKKKKLNNKTEPATKPGSKKSVPEQILDFIVDRSEDDQKTNQVINQIIESNLKNIKPEQKLSQEKIEEEAQKLVEARATELLQKYHEEINYKRTQVEDELKKLVEGAQQEAQDLKAQAQQEIKAEQLNLEKAKQEFTKHKDEFAQFVEAEKQRIYEEVIQEVEPLAEEFVEVLKQSSAFKKQLADEIKQDVVAIALDVAKQILAYEAKENQALVQEQLIRSISKILDTKGVIQVYLNPGDLGQEAELKLALDNILDASVRVIFLEDAAVSKGSVVINTQGGRLDANFTTQLKAIKLAFERYLGHKIAELPENTEEQAEEKSEPSDEPSESELAKIEESQEEFADMDLGEDLESLLAGFHENVVEEPGQNTDMKPQQSEIQTPVQELLDLGDSTELGANDFSNGEDVSLLVDIDDDDDDSKDEKADKFTDGEGNEFVEFDEFAGDDNFSDDFDGSAASDHRFPEY